MTDDTIVPCSPPNGAGSWAFSGWVSARPANSGCAMSSPESTIVTGTPGPGAVSPEMPICESHHSSVCRGSGVSVVAVTR